MSGFDTGVLSERLQDAMSRRRLQAAVFCTYQFEPGFFEREIIPVFLDLQLGHIGPIRLVLVEDALRPLAGKLAVYYDPHGLVASDAEPPKLDIARIPVVAHGGGFVFHPKNVFALCDDLDDAGDVVGRSLIVLTTSANLTRAGWWENVESAHLEVITEGTRTRLHNDLRSFLTALRRRARGTAADDQPALAEVLEFLNHVGQFQQRSSSGRLHPHFYRGGWSLADFLDRACGSELRGMNMEVISPYLDVADVCEPLRELVERFRPRQTRVLLPDDRGQVACTAGMYDYAESELGAQWGQLPDYFLRLGKSQDAGRRRVHAKVYRFWSSSPRREIVLVGSVNLTTAGHAGTKNVETGVLVEVEPPGRAGFWLEARAERPLSFANPINELEDAAANPYVPLVLRYDWAEETTGAYWDAPQQSPAMEISAAGVVVVTLDPLPPRSWTSLPKEDAERIGARLRSTSILQAGAPGATPGAILVQETGMAHRPSLLLDLTPAQILQYWSLLTPAQRSVFLEATRQAAALAGADDAVERLLELGAAPESMFDRFAGIFHGFGALRRSVLDALGRGDAKLAAFRVFGRKYDSLGTLLDRLSEEGTTDLVDRYVMLLCARQFCDELRRLHPEFWASDLGARHLTTRLQGLDAVRAELSTRNDPEMNAFLAWFEKWFLRRAEPLEVQRA
jgi:hypothetical protein